MMLASGKPAASRGKLSADLYTRGTHHVSRAELRAWPPWLVLVGVTALGGIFRLANLAAMPPGQFLDESLVSLLARDLAAAHEFPVYIAHSGGGYHPAIIYLTRLARWLTAGHPFAARYAVATLSTLSLPLICLALRSVFELDEPRPRAVRLALLATFVVACAVPYAIVSRTGSEMTLTTPLAALTFLGLALGLRRARRGWFVLAGIALGLSLYTYYSARLLPLSVAGAWLWLAWSERRDTRRPRLGALALVAAAALIVALPLGIFFLQHPDLLTARAFATSQALREGPWPWPVALAASTGRTLAGLVLPGWGDAQARHNLPGRPFFDAFVALLFCLGVIAALRGRRRSHALLLAWGAGLLLPTILTPEGSTPHFTRLIAATPALAGLVALGGWEFALTLDGLRRPLGAWLLAGGLAFSLAASAYDFFGRWARLPALYEAFMVQD
jgi:4-amino-4-deoxy-L-arabinose transferase-like glycosyltransferase